LKFEDLSIEYRVLKVKIFFRIAALAWPFNVPFINGISDILVGHEFLFSRAKKGTKKALFRYHGDIRSENAERVGFIL
tara:strand:- start:36 stop:269 length:234 start_codon:yes stop_codon:yes gene_type:complete